MQKKTRKGGEVNKYQWTAREALQWINHIGELFAEKHEYEFTGRLGNTFSFIDEYFFSLDDVIYDLSNNIEKGKIFKWHREVLERTEKKLRVMNFETYCMGLTWDEIDRADAEKLKILRGEIKSARKLLKNSIKNNGNKSSF